MNPVDAMLCLRFKSRVAFEEFGFEVKSVGWKQDGIGGRCNIKADYLDSGSDIFILRTTPDLIGTDYYYPYANTSVNNGAGRCDVPQDAPIGTMVVTDGMNGCSMQVDAQGGALTFTHYINGNGEPNASTVCRIDYKHYAGPEVDVRGRKVGLGVVYNLDKLRDIDLYSYYNITVKTADGWDVYASGIAREYTNMQSPKPVFHYHKMLASWANQDGFVYKITSFK